jgi:hypothetical protein
MRCAVLAGPCGGSVSVHEHAGLGSAPRGRAQRAAQVGHALPGSDLGSDLGSRPASMDFGFGAARRPALPSGFPDVPAAGGGAGSASRPASLDYGPRAPPRPASVVSRCAASLPHALL